MGSLSQQHELLIENPNRVYGIFDSIMEELAFMANIIETTSRIADMNLSIGIINEGFRKLAPMVDKLNEAKKNTGELKDQIVEAVDKHNRIHSEFEW